MSGYGAHTEIRHHERQAGRSMRSDTAQFPPMGQEWGVQSHTATNQQKIGEPENDRNRSYVAKRSNSKAHNLDAINQSLEQNRKAEQRKSRGWSMSR